MTLRLSALALALLAVAAASEDARDHGLAAAAWIRDAFVVVFVDAADFVSGCF